MKRLLYSLLLLLSIASLAQPLDSKLRVSLFNEKSESVDLLKKVVPTENAYSVKCFTREYQSSGSQNSDMSKTSNFEKHDIMLKVPCSKKDSSSYDMACYSFEVSFYNAQSIKLIIDHNWDTMQLCIENIPFPVPSSDIVIDPLVFNPGSYVIAFDDLKKNRFERLSASDTLRNRNICNSCFLINGSPNYLNSLKVWQMFVDDKKLLVIVNHRTIKNIGKFEKFLMSHNLTITENPTVNKDQRNVNKVLIIAHKDSRGFSRDNCPELDLLRKNKYHVKFAGQLMHYGKKEGIGVAYTNHIVAHVKENQLDQFRALADMQKLKITRLKKMADNLMYIDLNADDNLGYGISEVEMSLKESKLTTYLKLETISTYPVLDLGPQ